MTTESASTKISDIFQKEREDQGGYDANKLHVGDFIDYDAGTQLVTSEEKTMNIKYGQLNRECICK